MSVTALVVRPDGTKTYTEVEGNLESLSDLVGEGTLPGEYKWIEHVFVTYGVHAYVNEEGKIYGLPDNPVATRLAGYEGVDVLCGTVVFLGDDGDGNEADLPSEWQAL